MTSLKMLTATEVLGEIRRLYFDTTRDRIEKDFERALDLLKAMSTEEERERATVYMEGLAEMRKEWTRTKKPSPARRGRRSR
jgi:hypothetical protein